MHPRPRRSQPPPGIAPCTEFPVRQRWVLTSPAAVAAPPWRRRLHRPARRRLSCMHRGRHGGGPQCAARGRSEEQEQQEEESGSLPGCRSAAAQSRPRGRHLGNSLRGQRRRQHRYGAPGGTGRARGARSAVAGRGSAPGAGSPLSAAAAGSGSGRAVGPRRFPPTPWKLRLHSSPREAAFIPRRGGDGGAAGAAAPSLPPWRSCLVLPAAAVPAAARSRTAGRQR